MIDLKPYGAFVENTIRPLLDRLDKSGLRLDRDNIIPILKEVGSLHLKVVIIQSVSQIVIMGLICYVVWMTLA